MSNDIVVKQAIRLPCEKSIISEMPSIKFKRASFVTFTPLGSPVEPDVYKIYEIPSSGNFEDEFIL